ncbi:MULTISPECIES: transposase [Shewanella]|uniref:Transposase n=2 Tax=Shewanella TaxID=22 RepID=A0A974XJP6_9GAMM|nr:MULTISPECIES: transposase [Shewanella]QSX29549.1 transposase [Shewanella cyperi]QSX36718.1 transposase [Shewanella sedimentimangrovi]QSX40325.1 transposase [Shewanella cyperi]
MNLDQDNLKLLLIAEVKARGRLLSDVAKEYGISSKTLYQWVRQSEQQPWQREQALHSEIALLQRRIRALSQELDVRPA